MLYTIHSDAMTASVSSSGAELMSLRGADGTEYLWQGDKRWWQDRSPTIFPYVARLTDGCYRYQGQLYHMPIHGFAPTAEFAVGEQRESSVTLVLESTPELYRQYPFRFCYRICYRLEGSALRAEITVENLDEKTMFFGLGGHPGFNVPLVPGKSFEDYRLRFAPKASRYQHSPGAGTFLYGLCAGIPDLPAPAGGVYTGVLHNRAGDALSAAGREASPAARYV